MVDKLRYLIPVVLPILVLFLIKSISMEHNGTSLELAAGLIAIALYFTWK